MFKSDIVQREQIIYLLKEILVELRCKSYDISIQEAIARTFTEEIEHNLNQIAEEYFHEAIQ